MNRMKIRYEPKENVYLSFFNVCANLTNVTLFTLQNVTNTTDNE